MEILDSCAPAGGEDFPVRGLENNSEEITVDPDFTQTHKRHSLGEGGTAFQGTRVTGAQKKRQKGNRRVPCPGNTRRTETAQL